MGEELEYRYPVKLLTNRDPIIAGKLSILEMFEWIVFALAMYAEFNWLPSFIIFVFRLVLVVITLAVAFVFIHTQINGLSPLEWIVVNTRSWLERGIHQAIGWLTQQKQQQPQNAESGVETTATNTITTGATATTKAQSTTKNNGGGGNTNSKNHSILTNPAGSNRHKPNFQSVMVTLNNNSNNSKPEPEEQKKSSEAEELVEEI